MCTVPTGEFIRVVLSCQVEIEAELCVDAETKVVVHLDDL